MSRKLIILTSLILSSAYLSGCGPLVVGAAAAVIADEAVEQKQGGDGLF